jgi:hypothetical protein
MRSKAAICQQTNNGLMDERPIHGGGKHLIAHGHRADVVTIEIAQRD